MISRLCIVFLFYFSLAATLGAVALGAGMAGLLPGLPQVFRFGFLGAAAVLGLLSLHVARAGIRLLACR